MLMLTSVHTALQHPGPESSADDVSGHACVQQERGNGMTHGNTLVHTVYLYTQMHARIYRHTDACTH